MKKWIALLVVALALLFAYVAGGPFIAMWGIKSALADNDTAKLQRHVDLQQVRDNIKAQLEDAVSRKLGTDGSFARIGAFAVGVLGDKAVDAATTTAGISAILSGRSIWKTAARETVHGDFFSKPLPPDPLKDAQFAYVSASEFDATIHDENGKPMVFVFSRDGLDWKLTNIRLDFNDAAR